MKFSSALPDVQTDAIKWDNDEGDDDEGEEGTLFKQQLTIKALPHSTVLALPQARHRKIAL